MKKQWFYVFLIFGVWASASMAQALYAGDPFKWNELKTGDEILLGNGGTKDGRMVAGRDFGQFLCGYTVAANGGQTGLSLAKTDTLNFASNTDPSGHVLSDANVWILEDAGRVKTLANEDYPAFFLKNKKTGEYIEAFTVPADGVVSHTTPSKEHATPFVFRSADTYRQTETNLLKMFEDDPDYGALLSHYEVTKDTLTGLDTGVWYQLGHYWDNTYTYYGTDIDKVAWNVLKVASTESWEKKVSDYLVSIIGTKTFIAGTDPGMFGEKELKAYENVLVSIYDAVDYGYYPGGTGIIDDSQWEEWYRQLIAAYEAVLASQVPLTDGFYYIIIDNDYSNYYLSVEAAYYPPAYKAGDDRKLWYGPLEINSAQYVWQITKTGEETYSVKNLAQNTFLGYDDVDGHITMGETPTCGYAFVSHLNSRWNLIPGKSDGLTGGLWTKIVGKEGETGYMSRSDDLPKGEVRLVAPSAKDLALMGVKVVAPDGPRDNTVYSLDGKRVSENGTRGLPKGIYIVNGTKVAVTK